MEKDKLNKKLAVITDPEKMKSVFVNMNIFNANDQLIDLNIDILKNYVDEKSYGITMLYSITLRKNNGGLDYRKIIGSASSWDFHKYTFEMTNQVTDELKSVYPNMPAVYGYLEEYGLFLRDYVEGESLTSIILKNGFLNQEYASKAVELIASLRKITPPKGAKRGVDFENLDYNIQELKKKDNKDILDLEKRILDLKDKMNRWQKTEGENVVHGDFNTFNILIQNSSPLLIDFEGLFIGDYLLDPAMFVSHIGALQYRGLSKEACKTSQENFLVSYKNIFGEFSNNEQDRFNTYRDYFDCFIIIHKLMWG